MEFTDELIFEIQVCDRLFKTIDKDGDCQLSLDEFEAYVKQRNSDEDAEMVMSEFRKIDNDGDG